MTTYLLTVQDILTTFLIILPTPYQVLHCNTHVVPRVKISTIFFDPCVPFMKIGIGDLELVLHTYTIIPFLYFIVCLAYNTNRSVSPPYWCSLISQENYSQQDIVPGCSGFGSGRHDAVGTELFVVTTVFDCVVVVGIGVVAGALMHTQYVTGRFEHLGPKSGFQR